jgi:hypothetical protein
MYLKILDDVNEMIFREYLHPRRPEEEVAAIPKSLFPDASCILSDEEWGSCCEEIRRVQGENMDKYAVEIDPDKVEKEKVGSKGGKPTSDPNVNIPLDPNKGSEPFEKEPADGGKKSS